MQACMCTHTHTEGGGKERGRIREGGRGRKRDRSLLPSSCLNLPFSALRLNYCIFYIFIVLGSVSFNYNSCSLAGLIYVCTPRA